MILKARRFRRPDWGWRGERDGPGWVQLRSSAPGQAAGRSLEVPGCCCCCQEGRAKWKEDPAWEIRTPRRRPWPQPLKGKPPGRPFLTHPPNSHPLGKGAALPERLRRRKGQSRGGRKERSPSLTGSSQLGGKPQSCFLGQRGAGWWAPSWPKWASSGLREREGDPKGDV